MIFKKFPLTSKQKNYKQNYWTEQDKEQRRYDEIHAKARAIRSSVSFVFFFLSLRQTQMFIASVTNECVQCVPFQQNDFVGVDSTVIATIATWLLPSTEPNRDEPEKEKMLRVHGYHLIINGNTKIAPWLYRSTINFVLKLIENCVENDCWGEHEAITAEYVQTAQHQHAEYVRFDSQTAVRWMSNTIDLLNYLAALNNNVSWS